ncbi:hypothetical protein ERJ75_000735400 [Trypanosoma vivax]|nr:hypothetical protein ERJ75_000735400 [Trypanosoma vivax]
MVSFELPKGGDFNRAFKATKECFQNERCALAEGRFAPFQLCEAALSQIRDQRQHMKVQFTAADGENEGLQQRICVWKVKFNARSSTPKVSRRPTERSRLRMGFRKLEGAQSRGNARRERTKWRAQRPVAAAVGGDGFSGAHNQRAAAAGK